MSKTYPIVASNYIEGATEFIKTLQPGTAAVLVREPTNKFDANAVAVWVQGRRIGYIPKAQNKVLAPFIDDAGRGYNVDALMAMDAGLNGRAIDAKFIRSPNSSFPLIEV